MRYQIVDEGAFAEDDLAARDALLALLFRLESSPDTTQAVVLTDAALAWFGRHPGFEPVRRIFTELLGAVLAPLAPGVRVPEELLEVRNMLATRAEAWKQQWLQEGEQKGREEGRQEGEQRGRQEGRPTFRPQLRHASESHNPGKVTAASAMSALCQDVVEAAGVQDAQAPVLQRRSVSGGDTIAGPARQRTKPALQLAQQQGRLAFPRASGYSTPVSGCPSNGSPSSR
jgi:hypothetical protein